MEGVTPYPASIRFIPITTRAMERAIHHPASIPITPITIQTTENVTLQPVVPTRSIPITIVTMGNVTPRPASIPITLIITTGNATPAKAGTMNTRQAEDTAVLTDIPTTTMGSAGISNIAGTRIFTFFKRRIIPSYL
jgi:hypothetical protein